MKIKKYEITPTLLPHNIGRTSLIRHRLIRQFA